MPQPAIFMRSSFLVGFFQEVPPRKKVETPVVEKDPRKRKAAKSSGPSGMGNPGQDWSMVGWFGMVWSLLQDGVGGAKTDERNKNGLSAPKKMLKIEINPKNTGLSKD